MKFIIKKIKVLVFVLPLLFLLGSCSNPRYDGSLRDESKLEQLLSNDSRVKELSKISNLVVSKMASTNDVEGLKRAIIAQDEVLFRKLAGISDEEYSALLVRLGDIIQSLSKSYPELKSLDNEECLSCFKDEGMLEYYADMFFENPDDYIIDTSSITYITEEAARSKCDGKWRQLLRCISDCMREKKHPEYMCVGICTVDVCIN